MPVLVGLVSNPARLIFCLITVVRQISPKGFEPSIRPPMLCLYVPSASDMY